MLTAVIKETTCPYCPLHHYLDHYATKNPGMQSTVDQHPPYILTQNALMRIIFIESTEPATSSLIAHGNSSHAMTWEKQLSLLIWFWVARSESQLILAHGGAQRNSHTLKTLLLETGENTSTFYILHCTYYIERVHWHYQSLSNPN